MWGTLGEQVSISSLGSVLLLILHSGLKGPDTEARSASTCQSDKWASKVEINIGPQTRNKNINKSQREASVICLFEASEIFFKKEPQVFQEPQREFDFECKRETQ